MFAVDVCVVAVKFVVTAEAYCVGSMVVMVSIVG